MWVARNKDKRLWCALNKPIRIPKLSYVGTNAEPCQWDFFHENAKDYGTDEMALELPISWFPDLKWEDEPIEVTLLPTISK